MPNRINAREDAVGKAMLASLAHYTLLVSGLNDWTVSRRSRTSISCSCCLLGTIDKEPSVLCAVFIIEAELTYAIMIFIAPLSLLSQPSTRKAVTFQQNFGLKPSIF